MATENSKPTRPWYRKKRFLLPLVFVFLITVGGFIVYLNFNRLLSDALLKSFDTTLASDVYELKFKNLYVNLIVGDIRVSDVVLQPRAEPLVHYPYINSDFKLTTHSLLLKRVKVMELLRNHKLILERIEINTPKVDMRLEGEISVLVPFKDSTDVEKKPSGKTPIEAFHLMKFQLIDASFHVINTFKQRELNIEKLNFTLTDLYISQKVGKDSLRCGTLELAMDSIFGKMQQSSLRQFTIGSYSFSVEGFEMMKSINTIDYNFINVGTLLTDLDIDMADSVFHVALKKFGMHYKNRTITLEGLRYEPNISEAELRKRKHFQSTEFSCNAGKIELQGVNFDSLMHGPSLLVDEVIVDSVGAELFKDKTKPPDLNKFPGYPGQSLAKLDFPLYIKKVTVKNGNILNRERKTDGTYAKVIVSDLNATVTNVRSGTTEGVLAIKGGGNLENKVKFNVELDFDYGKPQFALKATTGSFVIGNLNRLLSEYTPIAIDSGKVNELVLEGTAYSNRSVGTMKFLYSNLYMDVQLEEKAKWKSALGTLAANKVLNSSNPVEPGMPPKIVKYEAERDMNKGFINLVLKSLFAGMKETMILTKDNRKNYNEQVKEMKKKEKGKQKK